jgi:hypothetical protein
MPAGVRVKASFCEAVHPGQKTVLLPDWPEQHAERSSTLR